MKKNRFLETTTLLLFAFLIFISCGNDNDNVLASLETTDISDITTTTAISGGNIISDGGSNVTSRGVCWSTTTNPTTSESKTVDGSGTGGFSSTLTGLTPGTTYFAKAYAVNSEGVSYGGEKSFVTKNNSKDQIIADHTIVKDFEKIPANYLAEVKKMMVSFAGESHAMAYRHGMTLLKGIYPDYASSVDVAEAFTDKYLRVDNTGWIGEDKWFTWFAHSESSRPAEKDAIKNIIKNYSDEGHPFNILGFAWCWDHTNGDPCGSQDPSLGVKWYGFSVGGPDGNRCWGLNAEDFSITGNRVSMDTYLNATLDYIEYCKTNNLATKIVFTTCPVDELYDGECGYQGHLKQEHIRSFVKADPSRILFDYADILCYDDNGSQTTKTWNGHTFPSITPTNLGDGSIGHIGSTGAIRLAKAQWWLLARIAGWDGN